VNVMWVEDFGGNLPADSKTLVPLFQGLVKREVFIKHWDDEDDLLAEPAILSDFFVKHSDHEVVLLNSVFDYLDHAAQREWTKHDVFAIDINLERRADARRDLPAEFQGVEKSAFHRKAGFYIYNHLIRSGVPAENICFLTGEKASTLEFLDHCRSALMPQPTAFEKSDSGFQKFRDWLRQRQENPYVTLRRAVIDGCDYLRHLVEADEASIQFREFIGSKGADPERITRDGNINYLDTLAALLPNIGHADTRSGADDLRVEQLYRLFVRTLAHEWEDAASPVNLRRDLPPKQMSLLRTLGWIMKNVRNWMAHNSVINQLAAEDVAFLFLVNMRAMFDLGPKVAPYERPLLALFSRDSPQPAPGLSEDQLRDALVQSYRKVKEWVLKSRQARDAVSFNEMVNNLVLAKENAFGVGYVCLLRQMFWHGLSPARLTNTAPAADRKTGERNLALYFTFNCRMDNYRSAENDPDDFLLRFATAIYRHSFPQ
jgi:hypothetical protein